MLAVFCSGSTNQSYRFNSSTSINRNTISHHQFQNPICGHTCCADKVFRSKVYFLAVLVLHSGTQYLCIQTSTLKVISFDLLHQSLNFVFVKLFQTLGNDSILVILKLFGLLFQRHYIRPRTNAKLVLETSSKTQHQQLFAICIQYFFLVNWINENLHRSCPWWQHGRCM